ncbi:hypothetical protein RB2654_14350 [Rhodobacterales bacterium HTCC2654]|uniref:Uncharacterized protein n=1 Tax=Maritimibacter alkaliphilus HTCC2654 TaxID=314271 RepID=A3VGR9_9RHOB|nr:hypothetical protein RB2654_14350 [Rhodobacterales bacterium HTCC2654] [Maritimibacter alkaliphilus HTCC2654]
MSGGSIWRQSGQKLRSRFRRRPQE